MPEENNTPAPTAEEADETSATAHIIAPHRFVKAEEEPVRSPEFKTYYSNQAGFMATQYDITVSFSRVGPDPKGKAVGEHQCNVAMSYEHAQALGILLLNAARDREKEFGPLFILPKSQQRNPPPDAPKEKSSDVKPGRAISLEEE